MHPGRSYMEGWGFNPLAEGVGEALPPQMCSPLASAFL